MTKQIGVCIPNKDFQELTGVDSVSICYSLEYNSEIDRYSLRINADKKIPVEIKFNPFICSTLVVDLFLGDSYGRFSL